MCRWYKIIYFIYSENSQEILQIYQIYLSIFLTMTRDFESVKSWTAHLLRSTASRRVFIISFDVSAESQNVTTSWDINMSQQLRQWVHDQLNEIIKMLIELRDQWNMTLKLNKQWIIVQVEHDKRLNQLEIKQMIIDALEETNKRYQEKMLNLKNKLKEVLHSTNQSRSHQSTESQVSTKSLSRQSIENHTWHESFTLFDNDHHKSFKFLNSFIFIDEDESTWDSWRIKINDKLQANVDHFVDETICIVYVISRLEDDAAEHIFAWCCHDALHFYISIYKLLEHLEEIYDNQNKNWKCRREYNALRQADKLFNVFYFNFMKLFSYLEYDDCILMNDLQNKINNRLQNALSICLKDFITLHCLKSFLQNVNNRQRVNYQLWSERCMIIVKVTVVSDKCAATSLSAMMTLIVKYVKSTIFSTSKSVRSFIVCYICKILDHLFKNCSQNKINTLTFHAFISRLHEIVILKNKENKKMSFKNSEAKN